MPENDQLQTEKEALKVAHGRVWGVSRLKVQWRELSLAKAYKLLQGDPVVLRTAAWKGRNDVMTRSMKTWFVRRVGLDQSGISGDAPITSPGRLVAV